MKACFTIRFVQSPFGARPLTSKLLLCLVCFLASFSLLESHTFPTVGFSHVFEKRLACSEFVPLASLSLCCGPCFASLGLVCVLFCFVWSFMCLASLRLICCGSCFVWVCCVSLFSSFGSFYMSCSAFFVLLCLGLLRPVTCLFVCLFVCLIVWRIHLWSHDHQLISWLQNARDITRRCRWCFSNDVHRDLE